MTKNLSHSIIKAVREGNIQTVKRFLKWHAGDSDALNARQKYTHHFFCGVTVTNCDSLAHLAVRHGRIGILKLLAADETITFNCYNLSGDTPLSLAVSLRNTEAVKALLTGYVDIDQLSHYLTALQLAAVMGHKEIVKILLDHGANPDYRSITQGYNAAEYAKNYGHADLADFINQYKKPEPTQTEARIAKKQ